MVQFECPSFKHTLIPYEKDGDNAPFRVPVPARAHPRALFFIFGHFEFRPELGQSVRVLMNGVEEFGLTEAVMHFGLSWADLLKFRRSAWLRPIWIGLAQVDLDRLILMNTPLASKI